MDDFTLSGELADLPIGAIKNDDRDLEKELFGSKPVVDVINALEEGMGLKPSKSKMAKPVIKHHLLSPSRDDDAELFNKLLNADNIEFIKYDTTWTPQGDYRLFVIYREYTLVKEKKEETLREDEN